MENSKNNTGKTIGTFLVGAAIGSLIGVLFAPQKGSKTREKINGKTKEFTDKVKNSKTGQKINEKAKELTNSIKNSKTGQKINEKTKELSDSVQAKFNTLVEDTKHEFYKINENNEKFVF
jgi:gas vesicle protein